MTNKKKIHYRKLTFDIWLSEKNMKSFFQGTLEVVT